MKYQQLQMLFFSGTGNSFRVAVWLKELAIEDGMKAHIAPVEEIKKLQNIGKDLNLLIGIVFPTHAFTAPWHLLRALFQLPHGNQVPCFVIATRAGTKIGPFAFPGMEGTAAYLIALIFVIKGYSVCGVLGLDMPSNWLSLHWGLSPKNAEYISKRAKYKIVNVAERILSGKCYFSGFISLTLGLLLLPITLSYLVLGRFFIAKLFFASYRCTGCGSCAKNCPIGAIKMIGKAKPRPYWNFSCESCMRCMGFCKQHAVEVSHSFAVILYYIISVPVLVYLPNLLVESSVKGWVQLFFIACYVPLSIFIAYWIFHYSVKIPLINRLFTFTTLTHFYRRYHEADTQLSDLQRKE